ncbi:hypothetical protein ISCGN_004224 [Ixodes scapularis]
MTPSLSVLGLVVLLVEAVPRAGFCTKWCGAGDVAKNYDDLGVNKATDMCCREHDHSGESIEALKSKHGITNTNLYTMTNCKDDRKFYNCLLNDSSLPSAAVGKLFFNVLRTKCFDYAYPKKCGKIEVLHQAERPCKHSGFEAVGRADRQHWDVGSGASPAVAKAPPGRSLPLVAALIGAPFTSPPPRSVAGARGSTAAVCTGPAATRIRNELKGAERGVRSVASRWAPVTAASVQMRARSGNNSWRVGGRHESDEREGWHFVGFHES